MVIDDIMSASPLTAQSTWTVRRALRALYENDFRHLPILDADDQLVGIVSERDLQVVLAPTLIDADGEQVGLGMLETTLGDCMSGGVVTVGPETEVREAIELMLTHRVGALPVVAPGAQELVGIVSYVDVLRAAQELV